ncbi:MAG: trypsin-like peptidase domain-containing protein, partial [Bacillota bacterium]|nr:trypsin-like peptidase domain-containing protein [Bacillota bacterium]
MNNQYSNNYQYNPVQEQQEYAETERLREIVREELEYNRPKKIWVKIIALLLVGALLGTGGTFAALHLNKSAQKPVATVTPETTADKMQIDINLNEDITIENAVATKAIPSIVGITAKVRGQQENYFFYNNEEYMTAQGSGVIVDSSGYILTNSHVVNNGDSEDLLVSFSDNSEAQAKLVWHDRTLDLAIVKVEKDNLVVAELGDSDQIQVGDKAIAVG